MLAAGVIVWTAVAGGPDDAGQLQAAIRQLDELDWVVLSVDYQDEPLERIMADLDQRMPVELRADWPALKRIGVRGHERVSFRLSNASAATVLAGLTLVLGDEFEHPIFEAHGGQIVLSTLAMTAAMQLVDVYDVRDLLADGRAVERLRAELPLPAPPVSPEASPERPAEDARETGPQREPDSGSAPQTQEAGEVERLLGDVPSTRLLSPGEELLRLISDHVDPEAWIQFGGSRAKISERNGVLMVTAPPTTHRRLREALRLLRLTIPSSISLDAAIVDLPAVRLTALGRRHQRGTAALAEAILAAAEATIRWRTVAVVSIGSVLEVESGWDDVVASLRLRPSFDVETGRLSLAVEASLRLDADHRRVSTTASFAHRRGGAVIELPPARPSDIRRLLVLIPYIAP